MEIRTKIILTEKESSALTTVEKLLDRLRDSGFDFDTDNLIHDLNNYDFSIELQAEIEVGE